MGESLFVFKGKKLVHRQRSAGAGAVSEPTPTDRLPSGGMRLLLNLFLPISAFHSFNKRVQ